MTGVLVVEAAASGGSPGPELEFLRREVLTAARDAFGDATVRRIAPEDRGPAAGDLAAELSASGAPELVLLLGVDPVQVDAPSLRRMAARSGGSNIVVPTELAEVHADPPSVTTRRRYELFEQRYLAGEPASPPGADPPRTHLPVALFPTPLFLDLLSRHSLEALVTEERLLEAELAERGTVAGLCYRFGDYYGRVRDDLFYLLPEGGGDLLEIGCGHGATGRALEQERGFAVTGIELDPAAAAEARRRLSRVIQGDLLGARLEEHYDVILGLDVFEHVAESEAFLRRCRELLKPDGSLILSVPNVGHHSLVEDLLAGRWDYVPMGLLCYTHLRFFTRRTLERWLARAGFDDVRVLPQRTALPAVYEELPFELDRESLATLGFHVVARRSRSGS